MGFYWCMLRVAIRCALGLSLLSPGYALALTEFQKISASDLHGNDNFGYSVSMSGGTAIVGAWQNDQPDQPGLMGRDAGAAYIFQDNGTGTWGQIDKLIASDFTADDKFGSSVAVDGDTAAIGAVLRAGAGGAYIFKDNGAGDWLQVDTLLADDAMQGDEFGYSISVSGNTAIVGAWQNNVNRGAAYVFRDDGAGDWSQIVKLTADDAMPGDRFGVSVAISGTTALVGAHFESNDAGPLVGAVYVFEEEGGSWMQADKLIASDAMLGNRFGRSIALDGDTAIIGATGDSAGGVEAGAAYIFQRDDAMEWQETMKLVADDPEANNLFGHSVSISEGNAVVGAYQDNDGGLAAGSAYFFRESSPGVWNQTDKLLASDDAANDAFGYSVAVSNGVSLVGAPLSNTGETDAGAAYLFQLPVGLPGDYNQNGSVDAADYALWRDMTGQMGTGLAADGNGDGTVDQADYEVWRANFGVTNGPAAASLQSAAVPEPAAGALLLIAIFPVVAGSYRRAIRS